MTGKQKKVLVRIIVSMAALILLHFLPLKGWIRFAAYMVPYGIIGYDILRKAVRGIFNGQVFDENFLMAVATVGAIVLAVIGEGDYTEAVAVMLFYQIGELFQSIAVGKSRRNIGELMDIRPDYAVIEGEDGTERVDPDDVEVGTIIVVSPGEKIPIDGVVVEGEASLNTAALTGESKPRTVRQGDEVISGMINMTGVLRIETTKEFDESTASKILELVENASMKKSRSENFISRFAKYYTPIVCLCAALLATCGPLVSLLIGQEAAWGMWLYRALTFLVISCPCALVISIPLSFFAAIGGASRAGVLVKGSTYLEALSQVDTVVMDKTGTLTEGTFDVVGIHPVGLSEEELLYLAAAAESFSSHPISKSLQRANQRPVDEKELSDVTEKSGYGVSAQVGGSRVACGNAKWMRELQIEPVEVQEVGTVVHVAKDGVYAGYVLIADRIKETSAKAMQELKAAGVTQRVMLTGDNENVAQAVAKTLDIDQVFAGLLPEGKVEQVEALLQKRQGAGKLAFVGDGINDAPVLSRADVGIAMGAMGSDAAIEAADVVLMDDNPRKIAQAISISRKCMRIVYENIVFALGIKILCLILGAVGFANMWLAIFADVGVMVIAVINAIRAMRYKPLDT